MNVLIITFLFSLLSYQKQEKNLQYSVEYLLITQTCHYCKKSLTIEVPNKIYNLPSNKVTDCLAVESAKMFSNALQTKAFDKEGCTSEDNRNTTHVFHQDEMRSTKVTKSQNYSTISADQIINSGLIQDFGELFPNTLKDSYEIVLAAYKNK
ncbi:hypothetical protein PQG46_06490 [Aquirufa nivalisilvae]